MHHIHTQTESERELLHNQQLKLNIDREWLLSAELSSAYIVVGISVCVYVLKISELSSNQILLKLPELCEHRVGYQDQQQQI